MIVRGIIVARSVSRAGALTPRSGTCRLRVTTTLKVAAESEDFAVSRTAGWKFFGAVSARFPSICRDLFLFAIGLAHHAPDLRRSGRRRESIRERASGSAPLARCGSVSRNGLPDCTRSVIPSTEIGLLKVGKINPAGRYRVSRAVGRSSVR